jgi:hypothetical protein
MPSRYKINLGFNGDCGGFDTLTIYSDYQEYLLLSRFIYSDFFDGSCFRTPGLPPHSEAGVAL